MYSLKTFNIVGPVHFTIDIIYGMICTRYYIKGKNHQLLIIRILTYTILHEEK